MDHRTVPCATSQSWFDCGTKDEVPRLCVAYLRLPHNLRYNCEQDYGHVGTHGYTMENADYIVYIRWGAK